MKSNLPTKVKPKWLFFFLIIVITSGIIFRLNNLSLKPYWIDESYTLLRASGYTAQEATKQLYTGKVITINDLLTYQRISPSSKFTGTIKGLAKEEPQHPPFYFLLTRTWGKFFGSSKTAMRSLPVVFSLLTFPAIYWLCLELFASPITGWMAMAFYSVSPIFLRYAQEVRQYSLWLTLITLSSAALLKTIKKPTKTNWVIYTSLTIIALYCQPLTFLIIIAHGIYFTIEENFKFSKKCISYLLSSLVSIISFTPWLYIIFSNLDTIRNTTSWMSRALPFMTLMKFWSVSISRTFFALHFKHNQIIFYLTPIVLLLIIFAFYFLYRYSYKSIWVFIFSLTGTTFIPFLIYDLIAGGTRSTNERFFLSCYLGIYLAISYLLVTLITTKKKSFLWEFITTIILLNSLIFCGVSSFANTWWGWSEHDVNFSRLIQKTEKPLIISDSALYSIMPFSHQLNPKDNILLLTNPNSLKIPNDFQDIFFYMPSQYLLSEIKQNNIKIEEVYMFEDTLTSFKVYLYQLKK